MVGKTILHYHLIEKIGAGGMGEIFKGQDPRLNRMVAVKILSPGLSTDPERKRRFFQEAQAASALNHPNIITLYDIVSDGDMQCIVMEYIAGKTLRDLIPSGGLPPAQAVQYAVQIASALAVAHASGLIHRDLKPSNIMVTGSGLIKVLDFGLAKWVDTGLSGQGGEQSTVETALTREGSIIGTVSYMSPEQAEGKRVDARSDIFSFGSVLYEMLTGKRAFEGRSGISTLSSILRDDVRPMAEAAPTVPPLLEQIVLRCLPKEPSARWQSMKEIEAALLTLQRQLDPDGRFAPPIPTGAFSAVSPLQALPMEAAAAKPLAAVSDSDSSLEAPGVAPPRNGQASPQVQSPPPRAQKAPVPSTPAAPPRKPAAGSRTFAGFPKMAVLAAGLLAAVLVAGAAVGGWYLWKRHQGPQPQQVASVAPSPAPAAAPPADDKKSPLGDSANATPPPDAAPLAAAPAAPEKESKASRRKRKPKEKVEAQPVAPPLPAPATPAPVPPPPVTTPAAPPPKPAPKPVIQTTPVTVGDALPFVMNLAEDVPSDAPDGQAVRFTVTQPLQVDGKTVIAKGATVTGSVTGESKKKFLGIGGGKKLTFRLTQVQAVDGRKLAVRAMSGKNSEGPAIRPFETDKSSRSKGYAALQGTMYVGYIDGDQMVSIRK